MGTSFPAALDALTNPTGADNLSTPGVLHSTQHANANDSIEAIEAKIGVDASAVTTSLDYLTKVALPKGAAATSWYAETVTSQLAVNGDVTGLAVTITAPAGRRYRITGHLLLFNDATAGRVQAHVQEGATVIGRIFDTEMPANDKLLGEASAVVSPSAGNHTYKITAAKVAGGGQVDTNTAAGRPLWVLVEDIGKA